MDKPKAIIEYKEMEFEVEIIDTKRAYGRERFLVKPVAGKGEAWLEDVRITK